MKPLAPGPGVRRSFAWILAGAVILTATIGAAQSGVQLTPDGKRALVSKDVGPERWAITLNPDGSVTGNVFSPGGGEPGFVACEEVGRVIDDGVQVTFTCSGADRCPLEPCLPSEWVSLGEAVLPESFFLSPQEGNAAAARAREGIFGSGGAASGVQRTPDARRTLISKDVGSERWAITLHLDDRTVTGNVFSAAGGDPKFVWCTERGSGGGQVEYSCLGADRCQESPCPAADWTFVAHVVLPEAFFAPPQQVDLDSVVLKILQAFGDEEGFVAVALAIDRGYSLAQILRAALSDRLGANGEITEKSGAPEAPEGPPLGMFSTTTAAHRVLGVSDLVHALGDRLGASLSPEQRARVLIALRNRGYTLSQIARIGVDAGVQNCNDAPSAAEFQACVATFGDSVALTDENGVVAPGDDPSELLPPPPGPCNLNGRRQLGEECDGGDLNDETCASRPGFVGGTLRCTDECTFDPSDCRREGESDCGDGARDAGEDCEGTDLGGQTCVSIGALFPGRSDLQFAGGALGCTRNHPGPCRFVTSGCLPGLKCGNGQLELGEPCDVAADGTPLLGGATCANLAARFPRGNFGDFVAGELGCIAQPDGPCVFDTRACLVVGESECGNGVIEGNEECDGRNPAGKQCKDLVGEGWVRGELTCFNLQPGREDDCTFDRDQCARDSLCGNGTIEGDEQCDGQNVAGKQCKDLVGEGWIRGELTCFNLQPGRQDDCTFNRDQCSRESECGNDQIEGDEECDREKFGGRTCESEGFANVGGALICDPATCRIDRQRSCQFEQRCNDDVAEGTEVCDGTDLRGEDCESRGFVGGGTLECVNCQFVETGCFLCNGVHAEGMEACDGSDLRGNDCTTIGLGYDGGDLACRPDCTDFDDGDCFRCDGTLCPGGECFPPGAICCPGGGACAQGDTCIPGGCCPPDGVVCAGGGCFVPGATCCPDGSACSAGLVCVDGGCCPAATPQRCGSGCIPAGADCCGGVGYCPAGSVCGPGGTCI